MDITLSLATDLYTVLGLDYMSPEEQDDFLDSVGAVVLESAILRYLTTIEEYEQSVFSSWIQAHSSDETMLAQLCERYPAFETILIEEISLFKNDAIRVLNSSPARAV